MAPTLGFTALLVIILLSTFLPICNFFAKKFNFSKKEFSEISLAIIIGIFVLSIITQLCLIYSYVASDYSVLNVYQNSHHLKPLIFKIAGSWGNHEGSMLLLLTVLSSYSLAFALIDKSEFKNFTLAAQSLIILGFASFTAFTSNPFERIFPAPVEGLSLNPILQDIGLALHPPMLYLGYVGFCIPFCLAIAGLLKEEVNQQLAKTATLWMFLPWGFLTLGIGLGAWWAYRELGWGGYWFWDPVENVSLMPWLAATALIHANKLLRTQNICKIWTIFLALTNFILCLIGIFLTRSGLLSSVHSFAVDAKRGFFVILLIAIIGGIAMLIFALKSSKIKPSQNNPHDLFSATGGIFVNNYILIISLFTVFLGTLYPIFSQNFLGQSISIGAKYYNQIFAILLLPFLIFLIIYYYNHKNASIKALKIVTPHNTLILLLSTIITFLIKHYFGSANLLEIVLLFLTLNTAFLSAFSKKTVSNLAHLGFTLLLIGVMLSSLGSVKEINIKQGEIISVSDDSNYQIRFDRIGYKAGKNFLAREGVFTILQNKREIGGKSGELTPQLRYYPVSDQTTNEAAIRHGIFGDLYLAIGNKDENDFYALRIYYKPFIYLIWLGCLIMFFAAMLKVAQVFFGNKNEVLLQIFRTTFCFIPYFTKRSERPKRLFKRHN